MKPYIITLDTGTTNTRARLFDKNRTLLSTSSAEAGVRMTAIDGNNRRLKEAVKQCLEHLLSDADVSADQVETILASGMITSNVGLFEIPHVVAPTGTKELAEHAQAISLPDVSTIPFTFIPGVKNSASPVTVENFEAMDVMRGEEVETIALLEQYEKGIPYLIILPGSHMKFVSTDREGRITGCLTTISGELLAAVTQNTILADACGRQFPGKDTCDRDMMLLGYRTAKNVGIGRACFSGRILSQFATKKKEEIASYLLGVCMQPDVAAILHSSALTVPKGAEVILAGKEPLQSAFADMLQEEHCFNDIHVWTPEAGAVPLSALGALAVWDRLCNQICNRGQVSCADSAQRGQTSV